MPAAAAPPPAATGGRRSTATSASGTWMPPDPLPVSKARLCRHRSPWPEDRPAALGPSLRTTPPLNRSVSYFVSAYLTEAAIAQ